jgi:hypothetical protein
MINAIVAKCFMRAFTLKGHFLNLALTAYFLKYQSPQTRESNDEKSTKPAKQFSINASLVAINDPGFSSCVYV